MENTIFIYHHLGLGDHLICNGLVRKYAETNFVRLFCKKNNLHNVSVMFSDNKNISLTAIDDDKEASNYLSKTNSKILKIGVALNKNFSPNELNCCWDKVFYDQAGIDFNISWSHFKFNKSNTQIPIPKKEYAFICDQGSDGIKGVNEFFIDDKLIKTYSNCGLFFDNIDIIQNASEIHAINSAYIHLIDRMEIPSTIKLFYHKNFIKKPYSDFTLTKKWKII